MADRPKRAALSAIVCAVGLGAIGATSQVACYDRACEGDFVVYGDRPGEGRMVDENTWESGAVDGVWLDYRAARTIAFVVSPFYDRVPTSFEAYISPVPEPLADPAPGTAPDNFSVATGNLAEFIDARAGGVNVYNATCASYYLRVVLRFAPVVKPPIDPDAGDGGDGSRESGADGSSDAAIADATLSDATPGDATPGDATTTDASDAVAPP
ncbi:MAG: hypothetical protein U0169_04135 [Polyangiaceae bacterium]